MITPRSVALALAIVGGAGSLGFVTVGDHFSVRKPTTPNDSTKADRPAAIAAPKVDRLSMPVRLAASATLSFADQRASVHPVVYSVSVEAQPENTSVVSPGLAYASLDAPPANDPFDKVIMPNALTTAPVTLPTPATETPEIAEEEDDATPTTLAVPMPRSKPTLDPSLPMPKLKPSIDQEPVIASNRILPGQNTVTPGPTMVNPGGIPIHQNKGNTLLAMLSPQQSPGTPAPTSPLSKAPVDHPPGTIVTPTPFGIPYVLQTQSVDTACLKPELVNILRQIEAHYGHKVVITSGYRNRGREGSLHRTCAAADIIMPGIGSHALAAYARTIPAVGGVGTYCHASMIHVDTGTPRDWKYGCGSYFAMRDGSAHWGRVPQED